MLTGPDVASALIAAGITHVVWIPDSDLGRWDDALSNHPALTLVRVCREAEAFAVAAGLWLGGRQPIVMIQCTGLFDAGDALRNVLHDMGLPLLVFVGVRNLLAHEGGPPLRLLVRQPGFAALDLVEAGVEFFLEVLRLADGDARGRAVGKRQHHAALDLLGREASFP